MTAIINAASDLGESELLTSIREHSAALDRGEDTTRRSFTGLGAAGLLGLGAPGNADGGLAQMADVISMISGECMSTGLSVWNHRMVVEYLLTAATPFSLSVVEPLLAGISLGLSGIASAFIAAAGCGSPGVMASPVEGGYRLNGWIRWVCNLHGDSVLVTAARTPTDDKFFVAMPLSTAGVIVGEHSKLLALDSTVASYVELRDAFVASEQVLSTDFDRFLAAVRPTFLILQSAMCVGLATTTVRECQGALLAGVNSVLGPQVHAANVAVRSTRAALERAAARVGGPLPLTKKELLLLRLAAADIASVGVALEVRMAGGAGYEHDTPVSRRYREAASIPVQPPTETELLWELARCE